MNVIVFVAVVVALLFIIIKLLVKISSTTVSLGIPVPKIIFPTSILFVLLRDRTFELLVELQLIVDLVIALTEVFG